MSKVKVVLLSISIAIVLAFLVGYGINTFYKEPKYEDFCGEREFKQYSTKESCETNDGKWTEFEVKPIPIKSDQFLCTKVSEKDNSYTLNCEKSEIERDSGNCNTDFYCRKEFEDVRKEYNRNVFIISVILGIASIFIGIYLNLTSVSSGLMGGGVLTFIYGSLRYWGDMGEYLRFIILAIALALLIWLAYKKIKK